MSFEDASNITFVNVQVTCPRCGARAKVIDGTYNLRDGLVTVLSAPDWSMRDLRHLQEALRTAEQLANEDPEAALSIVARASSRVANVLRRADAVNKSAEMGGFKAILKWTGLAVAGVIGAKASLHANLSPSEIAQIIDDALKGLSS